MGRVKLDLPEGLDFSTEIAIRITDINYGGHLASDAVMALIHEARVRFLRDHGFSELDAGGPGLIMRDAAIVYQSEALYGEVLSVEVGVGGFSRVGCDFFYRLCDR